MRVKNQVPRRGMTKKTTLTRVLGLWIQWKIPNFHSVHSQRYLSNGKTYLENFSPARQQRTVLKGLYCHWRPLWTRFQPRRHWVKATVSSWSSWGTENLNVQGDHRSKFPPKWKRKRKTKNSGIGLAKKHQIKTSEQVEKFPPLGGRGRRWTILAKMFKVVKWWLPV